MDTLPAPLFKRWPGLRPVAGKLSLVIAVSLVLLPSLLCAYLIKRYAVNLVFMDEWDIAYGFDMLYSGTLTLARLFSQANEHRIFFPRLLMLVLGHWTHLDTRAYMWATWTILCLLAVFLYLMTSRMTASMAGGHRSAMFWFIPVSWMVFSWRQFENLLWGIQVVVTLTVLCLVCTVYLLAKSERFDRYYWLAIFSSMVGSFSFANGLLIWPIGLLQLIGQCYLGSGESTKRMWLHAGVWSLFGLAVYVLYFIGYHKPPHHPSLLLFITHPASALQYFLVYWGLPLAISIPIAMVAGAILLTICGCTIACLIIQKKLPRAALKFFSLVLFALLSGLAVTIGRTGLGIETAPASRYVTSSSLGLIGSFALVRFIASDSRRLVLQGVLGSLIVFGAVTSYLEGAVLARSWWARTGEAAFFLRSYPCQPDNRLLDVCFSVNTVRKLAPFLEKYHLNVFYQRQRIDCPMDNEKEVAGGMIDMSAVTLKLAPTYYSVDLINNNSMADAALQPTIDSSRDATVKVTGWAVDHEAGGPPAGVLINVDGQQDFPAEIGQARLDVALHFNQPAYWHAGFVGSLPIEKLGVGQHLLKLKIISVDRRQYYQSERTWVVNIR